jgi:type IX secretion system PorP/SprF family membrane protein
MRFIFLFIFFFGYVSLNGQDVNFSQAYISGPYLNPALSGVFNGFVRFSSLYREQGRGGIDSPFKTYAITSDIRYKLKLFSQTEHDILGVGLYFMNDRVEIYDFNTNAIALSVAFHKSLDARRPHYLGIGFQGGVIQKNINLDNLTFEDMFNKVDAYSFPTMEPVPSNNFAVGDFSLGLYYTVATNRDMTISAGFAFQHFAQPNISFYRTETIIPNTIRLYPKYTFHAMLDTKLSPFTRLQPRAKIMSQGDFTDLMLGANYRISSFERDYMALHLGLSVHAVSDLESYYIGPVVPFVGFQIRNFKLGFSYDIVMTHLVNSRRNLNTFEFTVSYLGEVEDEGMVCPQF